MSAGSFWCSNCTCERCASELAKFLAYEAATAKVAERIAAQDAIWREERESRQERIRALRNKYKYHRDLPSTQDAIGFLLDRGATDAEMAEILNIRETSVRTYSRKILGFAKKVNTHRDSGRQAIAYRIYKLGNITLRRLGEQMDLGPERVRQIVMREERRLAREEKLNKVDERDARLALKALAPAIGCRVALFNLSQISSDESS